MDGWLAPSQAVGFSLEGLGFTHTEALSFLFRKALPLPLSRLWRRCRSGEELTWFIFQLCLFQGRTVTGPPSSSVSSSVKWGWERHLHFIRLLRRSDELTYIRDVLSTVPGATKCLAAKVALRETHSHSSTDLENRGHPYCCHLALGCFLPLVPSTWGLLWLN